MNELENKSVVSKEVNDFVDVVERVMLDKVETGEFVKVNCPIENIFTNGLYTRIIEMKEGYRITSKIHKTDHPFFILKGKCVVYVDGEEIVLEAPYAGVTKAGTRRILLILEDCIWATVHANPDNETLEEIEERIIEKRDNQYLNEQEQLDINAPKNLGYEH